MPTVKQQVEVFMEQLQVRHRKPVRPATLRTYQSIVNKWIVPNLGDEELQNVRNNVAKKFVVVLRKAGLKPASMIVMLYVLKMVIASARDEEGNRLYPVMWNADFIDAPIVVLSEQDAPTVTPRAIREAISRAFPADKPLYALLAGTGLRISEALALRHGLDDGIGSFWVPGQSKLIIRGTVSGDEILSGTKTEAGIREVDLCDELNKYIYTAPSLTRANTSSLLFPSTVGGVMVQRTIYKHLRKDGIKDAFHAFRRFRITHLRKNEVPEDLIQLWAGHAKVSTTDRYSKFREDVDARRIWVNKIGLGFEL